MWCLPRINVAANLTATQTRIETFSCPSDYTLNNPPGANSYVINQGGWMLNLTQQHRDGGPVLRQQRP